METANILPLSAALISSSLCATEFVFTLLLLFPVSILTMLHLRKYEPVIQATFCLSSFSLPSASLLVVKRQEKQSASATSNLET
jgi:hypothetical protein